MRGSAAGTRHIARAGAVNLAGGAVGSLIGLALAAVVGRYLGTDGTGTYFLVVAVFTIVSNVAELGADTGLVRFVSAARATGRDADVPGLLLVAVRPVVLGGTVVVAATAVVVTLFPEVAGNLDPGFLVLTAALAIASSLLAVILAFSRGTGDVLTYPLLQNVALPVLRMAGVAVAVLAGWGVTGLLASWMAPVLIVLALATAAAVRILRRDPGHGRPRQRTQPGLERRFWSFSAARGFSAAVEISLEWADVLLVGVLASPAEAGIYAVVTRCARASEVIQSAARVAVGPQISAALARRAVEEAGEIYGLVTAAMIWLSWPFFLLLAVFGDAVLSMFGPGFDAGAVPLAVLSLAMALATAAGTVQTVLLMGGRSSWQLADKSAALVLNVALNVAFIPRWGITGAALAWGITLVADTAVVVWQVQRSMGVRPRGRHMLTAAGLSLGVVGVLTIVSRLTLGSSVPVLVGTLVGVGAIYLAVSWPLRHRLGLTSLLAHR